MQKLKQESELDAGDFELYPVWCAVHGKDETQPWYDASDEETFRPWDDSLPASPESGLLLVSAEIRLNDGSVHPGACYGIPQQLRPSARLGFDGPPEAGIVGDLQPRIFLANRTIRFWGGIYTQNDDRQFFYSALAKRLGNVFPMTFVASPSLIEGGQRGTIAGFYRVRNKRVSVERAIHSSEEAEKGKSFENPFALEPLLESIETLAREGRLDEALAQLGQLVSDHPKDPRCWTSRAIIHARRNAPTAALDDATRAIECDPGNRDLYPWVCSLQLQLADFQSCLRYSDRGLTAKYGSWVGRSMHEGELTFLGARALFELGRFQDALDRLNTLPPLFDMSTQGDKLMTKKGLAKACEIALRHQSQKRRTSH